jgi:hypothetical protein
LVARTVDIAHHIVSQKKAVPGALLARISHTK